ncbi:MAG TPA: ABC transporter ATP-binding protein [Planctomycetota bacterium]|nr:ABC transporter ATP-binding protein [Planctomycetota bacterium]
MAGKVVVKELTKSYGAVQAVRGVSFEINDGEIFGLLGPNGAGKTSTLECVIGLREPDGGSIEICGLDAIRNAKEVKQRLGAVLQATYLQDKITPVEALRLFGSFYRRTAKIDDLLERFQLREKAHAYFETLSGGQRQRLAIALAVLNEPEFLLLDEPTAGLDPQSRRELHSVIRQMRSEGRTVLLTTHYIEEAEQLCDRIAIIDHGKVIACGTPRDLISKAQALPRIVLHAARPLDGARLKSLACVQSVENNNGSCVISTAKVSDSVIDLVKYLETERNELLDLHIQKPSLEDVFIELTGRKLRD